MKLLTTNYKLNKDNKLGNVTNMGLSLAPHTHSGFNVCPSAGACAEICVLYFRGLTQMPVVRRAMIRRTRMLFENKKEFLKLLHRDLHLLSKKNNPHCRLNVGSDIPWEKIDPTLFDYPITFYDYTKITNRAKSYIQGKLPPNYHLCYSYSERSSKKDVNHILSSGGMVNFVVDVPYNPPHIVGELESIFRVNGTAWEVIDGDESDIRTPEAGNAGKAICVRAKLKKSKREEFIRRGFIVSGFKI